MNTASQETRSTHDVVIRVRKGERYGQSYHKACYSPDLDDPAYWTRTCFSEACRPTSVCAECGKPLRREVPIP